MSTISEHMADDHKRCDDLFLAAEKAAATGDWKVAQQSFNEFHQAMARHLAMEEQVLFPDFETAHGSSMGPTQVMRYEHGQMRELMGALQTAADAENRDEFMGEAETLLVMMQQHNAKEEMMLYPMTDQVLAGQREDVLTRMQAVEEG